MIGVAFGIIAVSWKIYAIDVFCTDVLKKNISRGLLSAFCTFKYQNVLSLFANTLLQTYIYATRYLEAFIILTMAVFNKDPYNANKNINRYLISFFNSITYIV